MCCDLKKLKKFALRTFVERGILAAVFILVSLTAGTNCFSADFNNRILSLTPTQDQGAVGIKIEAEKEIGSRYTSYFLSKPPRVVFDFQGADVSSLPTLTKLIDHPVREVRVSLYEAATVKSGRIELILAERTPYKVQKEKNNLFVNFSPVNNQLLTSTGDLNVVTPPAIVSPQPDSAVPPDTITAPAAVVAQQPEVKASSPPESDQIEKEIVNATQVAQIISGNGEVFLRADGVLDGCKSFILKNPARFVLDCFGVTEKIPNKVVRLSGSVGQVRVGNYSDKVRFVFEGDINTVNKMRFFPVADGLTVRYNGKIPAKVISAQKSLASAEPEKVEAKGSLPDVAPSAVSEQKSSAKLAPVVIPSKVKNHPLSVEKLDFKVEDGKSFVLVTLSAPGEVMQPIKDKTLLRFGIKGATITPSLRRTVDASAFPSVIRQITPYTVNNRGQYDVRFAVELKGDAPYELKNDGNIVTLIVENGAFNSKSPSSDEKYEVTLSGNLMDKAVNETTVNTPFTETLSVKGGSEIITNETIKGSGDKKYSGQSVSLNFDNIEIRNVLLLIAEVSDTNIIANDDVKGIITLRLNNVPWDQALDVIMESKGLAMEREGSIVRIAPKEVILKRQLDKATMESQINDKSPSVTKAFSLNYGPVEDIAKKIEELLKGSKGTVSPDARTRQIIVTAPPSKLKEIEEEIIARLDVPDKQVTIEARIVEANSNFTRDLGVSWGISQQGTAKGPWDLNGAMITGGGSFTINPGTQATGSTGPVFNNSAGLGSQFSFGRIGIDSTILDLRLSALEASGYGKIVSTPRITTSNGEAAEISQGTQIPYQTTSDAGPETKFIDATLSLKVKPVINPDQSMILEIEVSNDSVGTTVATGIGSAPSINTKKAKTKVMVKNGETTVIGGIFIETETESESGIPLLRSIPFVGNLFKSTKKSKAKTELMIFITPRIVE